MYQLKANKLTTVIPEHSDLHSFKMIEVSQRQVQTILVNAYIL